MSYPGLDWVGLHGVECGNVHYPRSEVSRQPGDGWRKDGDAGEYVGTRY